MANEENFEHTIMNMDIIQTNYVMNIDGASIDHGQQGCDGNRSDNEEYMDEYISLIINLRLDDES